MSVFTLLMTIPQVLTIGIGHQAAGVSLFTRSAYLLSAILWFWFGLQKQDAMYWLDRTGYCRDRGGCHLWLAWTAGKV